MNRFFFSIRSLLLSVLLCMIFVAGANAQQGPLQPNSNELASTKQASAETIDPEAWRGILDTSAQALARDGLTDSDLDKLRNDTTRVEQQAAAEADRLTAERDLLQQRIQSLGPEPGENELPESENAKAQRDALNEQFSALDARVKLAAENEVRARQLREQISNQRHDRFFRSISLRTPGLGEPDFWFRFVDGFSGYARSFSLLLTDSASVFWQTASNSLYKFFALGFFSLLAILVFVRSRNILRRAHGIVPEHSQNAAVSGFLYYIRNGILPALLLYVIYWILSSLGFLTQRLDKFLLALTLAVSFFLLINCLIRVVFAPSEPSRRLASISDSAALRIHRILWIGLLLATVIFILNTLAVIFISPLQVKVGLSALHSLLVAGSGFLALMIYREDRLAQQTATSTYNQTPRFWRLVVLGIWLVTIIVFASAVSGYIAFGEFLSQQLVFGLIVILSAWLLLRFVDFIFLNWSANKIAEASETDEAVSLVGNAGQTAILGAGFLKLAIYSLAGMLLLLPWGYRTSDFYQLLEGAFFGFEVGGLSISISTVLLALALFLIGYTVTVGLKNWLNNKLLPTTSLDIGISNSISTVFGYIGVIVAAMLAISAAGFDLSSLAIVAGALSVGVGFGLQSIVNNFVSGLILLAERPMKAGDWVSTSGGDGYVRKISVRSTEIETFDRATIIVPNSSLITDTVTNWTHGNKTGRIIIPIGVSYNSDPKQVEEILLNCAKEHKLVLGRPAPVVYFMDFGASSLDFQLRCFLSDINWGIVVQSELRYAILAALREAKIELPFPQRDVNLKYPEELAKPKPLTRRKKPAPKKST